MEDESAMELLGNMDYLGVETRKEHNKRNIETWATSIETRSEAMDHIMVQSEMGETCTQFLHLEDYRNRTEEACRNVGTCLMCKGIDDTHQMNIAYNDEHTMGMTKWIKAMRKDKEWTEATTANKFFMVCAHLSTTAMRKERGEVSQYGAVRMSKEETKEMIRTNQRYMNFWVYVTAFEEKEDRGGNI
eukprot:2870962-Heterocapsa_arctica.AAC.1